MADEFEIGGKNLNPLDKIFWLTGSKKVSTGKTLPKMLMFRLRR